MPLTGTSRIAVHDPSTFLMNASQGMAMSWARAPVFGPAVAKMIAKMIAMPAIAKRLPIIRLL